jgi:carbonic anhydrase
MTPDSIIAKEGNARFREVRKILRDFLTEQRATASGQFPAAMLLSCADSCAPAKILFNLGMGDVFNARVAGNIENPDILGSMEFTTKVAGAKVMLGMGHSACGAVAGAIANAKLGNLTQTRDSPRVTRSGLGKRVSVRVPKRLTAGTIARQADPSRRQEISS